MKKSTKFCIVCVIVMIISFFVLSIMDKLIGGNATNGKIENGIYYVMSSDEVFIEVPKSTFIVSYVISCFVTLSIVFGVISLIILQIKAANSSFMEGEKK